MSPLTLNFVRWVIAFVLLLPLAAPVLRREPSVGALEALRAAEACWASACTTPSSALALQTSTPINVTLVGSSLPLWMLAVGSLFFGARPHGRAIGGALLSMLGVLLVLSRGEWRQLLALRLVPGDLYMILGTIAWALLQLAARAHAQPAALRRDWAAFLMAQLVFGIALVGRAGGRRVDADAGPSRPGLAAGRRHGLHRHRPGRAGLPLLGHRRAARGTRRWPASS